MTRSTRSANTPATNKSSNVGGGSTSAEESKSSDPPRRSNLNGTPVLHLVTTADLPGSAEGASSAGTASSRIGGSTSPPSTPTRAIQLLQDTPSSSTATPAPRAPPSSPSTIRLVKKGKQIVIVRTTPDSHPVPPERDLDYACPRDNCGVALMLKANSNLKKQDYPVCRRILSGNCAFSGLRVRYGDMVCWWFCAGELIIGECVWAYAIPNSGEPPQWANWCLHIGDCLLATDAEGVHTNVRLAGEEDVGKRCRQCKRDDPAILETDQLVAESATPFRIGCAVKLRKEWEATVNATADARKAKFSANNAAKNVARAAFEEASPEKPRQALAKGTKLDFS
eukprot:jgi/Undpi1/7002/HiC_scaffold_21.g09476.m1